MAGKTSSGEASTKARAGRNSRAKTARGTGSPWDAEELAQVRALLEADERALLRDLDAQQHALDEARAGGAEATGDDQADAGSATFEREHEMSLANNSRDLLNQTRRALGRLHAGTFGSCETCGEQIPKARLQAFPRATLCVACKQREERR